MRLRRTSRISDTDDGSLSPVAWSYDFAAVVPVASFYIPCLDVVFLLAVQKADDGRATRSVRQETGPQDADDGQLSCVD